LTDGQRRYKNAGGQLIQLQGYVRAFDQMAAPVTMFADSKATGQEAPPASQVSGFVLSALGAAIQTGALNDVILRIARPLSNLLRRNAPLPAVHAFMPIDTDGLQAAMIRTRQTQPGHPEPAGRDLEQGLGPAVSGAHRTSSLQAVLDESHVYPFDRMKAEVAKTCHSITGLHDALFPHVETAPPAAHAASNIPHR